MQRKKLEIELIKDNYKNAVNSEILQSCTDEGASTPTKDFKYENFR